MTTLKVNYKTVILIFFLPLFYGWLRYVPGLSWTFDLTLILLLISFIFLYKGIKYKIFKSIKNYIFFILLFSIPVISALMAHITYGQPIIYGLATYRFLILLVFVLILINLMNNNYLSIHNIQSSFNFLAWFSLLSFSLIYIFVDPNELDSLKFGNLVIDGGGYKNSFNLPKIFIVYGIFYYLCKTYDHKTRSASNAFSFILFTFFLLSTSFSRVLFLTVALSVTFLILSFNKTNFLGKLKSIIKIFPILGVVLLLLIFISPDYFTTLFFKYRDAFLSITGATEVDDWSANARIAQFLIVFPLILDNLFLGSGALSDRWMGGYEGVYGYLHPSDLGLIGIVFQIGIFGLFLLIFQYFYAFSTIRKFLRIRENIDHKGFYMSVSALLINTCLSSITTGFILYNPESIFLYIFVLKFGILSFQKKYISDNA